MTRRLAAAGFALTGFLSLAAPPAHADFRLEREMTLAPGGKFVLDSSLGKVVLVGDSPAGARIVITSERDRLDERFDFRFEETTGLAKVTIARKGGWLSSFFDGGWFRGLGARIEIHVPHATTLELGTSGGGIDVSQLRGDAVLSSSGGGVRAADVEGRIDASSSGGGVDLERITGDVVAESSGGGIDAAQIDGAVRAESSGGGVALTGIHGDVRAESSGGGVRVREAHGRVEATSSGGPVSVAFAAGNDRGGDIDSSGGGVDVEIDPRVSLSLDASASGGSVHCDLPVTVQGRLSRSSVHGHLNGGGAALRVSSSGGGVRIGAGR